MTIRWKIFRIANIVEIVMMVTILTLFFASNSFYLKNKEDIIGIAVSGSVIAITIFNCISNILLLHSSDPNNFSFFTRRTLFWFVSVLFFLACIFIILCVLVSYPILERKADGKKDEYFGMILLLSWMSVIALNGVYIFSQQILLFLKFRKQSADGVIHLVEEIGESPE